MIRRAFRRGCFESRITRRSRCCAAASRKRNWSGSAVMRLNEDQREAVLLKVYQGFKFEEMAEILECPVSTVKSRLYTALDLLKTTLAPVVLRGEAGVVPLTVGNPTRSATL